MLVFAGTIALTVGLYVKTPKGWFPSDDTGLIWGSTQASPEISFQAMSELQQQANRHRAGRSGDCRRRLVDRHFVVQCLGQSRAALHQPEAAHRSGSESAWDVINRLRPQLNAIPGLRVFMFPAQDVRTGGAFVRFHLISTRSGRPDYQELIRWAPIINDRHPEGAGAGRRLQRPPAGRVAGQRACRPVAASRLGVRVQDIQSALNNAFAQRQVSTLYTQRNKYRVILEIDPQYQRDPTDLDRIYVPGANGVQVPLSAVTRIERGLQPLVINHQGQFPAVTISFSLAPERDHRAGDAGGRPRGRRTAYARHDARRIPGRRPRLPRSRSARSRC